MVAVTHDRYFLDHVAEWILELDRGEGIPFKGNYSAWLEYKNSRLHLGKIIWYDHSYVDDSSYLLIANAITQKYYGSDKRHVNYSAVVSCFEEALSKARAYDYDLHFPKIGAGLAGGDWNIIEQLINDCDPDDKVKKICWVLPENN